MRRSVYSGGFVSTNGLQRHSPRFKCMVISLLPDGTLLENINTKWIRNIDMLPTESLPSHYHLASKRLWNKFWHAPIPHQARLILWRLYHSKFPSRSRLKYIMPTAITDDMCIFCGAIETDEHFLRSCPIKRPI
ncbi:hypothetical protein G6F56_011306 [Rhizopus delemar]|nr:hypothetical protein G6F56_011306 [Rhizopus delemar]